jgi:hypothetical protein
MFLALFLRLASGLFAAIIQITDLQILAMTYSTEQFCAYLALIEFFGGLGSMLGPLIGSLMSSVPIKLFPLFVEGFLLITLALIQSLFCGNNK